MASAGIDVIIPAHRDAAQDHAQDAAAPDRQARNRAETSVTQITGQTELADHGAHTVEGLLTRTVVTLAARTLLLTHRADAI